MGSFEVIFQSKKEKRSHEENKEAEEPGGKFLLAKKLLCYIMPMQHPVVDLDVWSLCLEPLGKNVFLWTTP